MTIMSYKPFFDYLKKHHISMNSIELDGIVCNSILRRMKMNKNITMKTICRLMDYFEIEDVSQVMAPINVKDKYYVKVREN